VVTVTTNADSEQVVDFPFPPGSFGGPSAEHDRRRAECPLSRVRMPDGQLAHLVLRYDDMAELLKSPDFSRNVQYMDIPRDAEGIPRFLLNMDPPQHTRLRRLVSGAFTPRRAQLWRPVVQEIVDGLLDAMEAAGPPLDLVAQYATHVPIEVMCRLLGVPEVDRDRFRAWEDLWLSVTGPVDLERRQQVIIEFFTYVAELVALRRAEPGDGLIDVLIAAREQDDRLSEAELVDMVISLLFAGHETVASTIARGTLTLLRHPDQYRALAADPSLVPAAVEELLRYDMPGDGGPLRVTTTDVTLPSGTIPAGSTVKIYIPSANRDPAVFPDGDRFDITRSPNPHLGLGAGQHFCLGAALARVELEVAIGSLAARFPGLGLVDPPEAVPYVASALHRTVRHLQVTW
jgi:cytochrome P450